jgi:signal transduction histidine kinase
MFFVMEAHKEVFPLREMAREIVQRIRNPLNALQLNIDSLEDDVARANIENSLERLKRIRNTIGELDSLLCEILRLVDPPKPQITYVNINALVREVETFVRPESLKKEVTVKVDLKENLPDIQADPVQLKHAVLNVLLNAIEACAVKGSVTLATEAKDSHIILTITDSGGGILEIDRDRIFEPFFSTKEGHAGLGLPLALEIVKMHQGRLSYTSQVGTGTTFLISLPTKQGMRRR